MSGSVFLPAALAAAWLVSVTPCDAQATKGSVLDASAENSRLTWDGASLTLPAALTGSEAWQGTLSSSPSPRVGTREPVVILMHGSSGNAPFIKEYQRWLAQDLGLASIAPDSLAIPDRLTYTSPIDKPTYERVHALRLAELENALTRAIALPWVDPTRIVVIGTSEGAVPIARLSDARPVARVMYAWSCERNYFVEEPRTAIPRETPVLSMIAAKDPYFSPENSWSGDAPIKGTCTAALKNHRDASVVTISTDKHTIVNMRETQDIARAFLSRVLGRAASSPTK